VWERLKKFCSLRGAITVSVILTVECVPMAIVASKTAWISGGTVLVILGCVVLGNGFIALALNYTLKNHKRSGISPFEKAIEDYVEAVWKESERPRDMGGDHQW
jgi:hypothetical protein